MTELNDRKLLERLRDGDKEAFKVVFERNYPIFIAFARKLLRDGATAEDIVQNVFLRLWIGHERIDPERSLRNYLLVSVRNEIYAHFRSAFNARREGDLQCAASLPDRSPGIENDYSAQELEQIIERVISRMPERRREIFAMSRHDHLTNAQIAEQLGLSVRTVEKHIELALHEIRSNLPLPVLLLVTLLW